MKSMLECSMYNMYVNMEGKVEPILSHTLFYIHVIQVQDVLRLFVGGTSSLPYIFTFLF